MTPGQGALDRLTAVTLEPFAIVRNYCPDADITRLCATHDLAAALARCKQYCQ
jgi:hypothetical protein